MTDLIPLDNEHQQLRGVKMKKDTNFSAWKSEPAQDRFLQCIALLYINGIISPKERDNAHVRLKKYLDKQKDPKGQK